MEKEININGVVYVLKQERVLAADGLPIEVGQTLWYTDESFFVGHKGIVSSINESRIDFTNEDFSHPEKLTHTPPKAKQSDPESPYVMCRGDRSGVFAGYLAARKGQEVTLTDARRIWYWSGAASLSELATRGTSDPEGCKFPAPVPEVLMLDVIEIIPISEAAKKSIEDVAVWTR